MSASPSASTSVVASGCASTNSAPSWSTTSLIVSYLVRTLRNICCCKSTVSVIFSIRAFDFSRDRSKALTVVSLASACSTRSRIASTSFSLVSAFSSASLIRVCKASTSFLRACSSLSIFASMVSMAVADAAASVARAVFSSSSSAINAWTRAACSSTCFIAASSSAFTDSSDSLGATAFASIASRASISDARSFSMSASSVAARADALTASSSSAATRLRNSSFSTLRASLTALRPLAALSPPLSRMRLLSLL
mmetsp:Transcript_6368/g.14131  ORF Transcript_6368/g.14131 Transcript_6368/m.14131 type:complete len:254 (+) Transcript_6368:414-1175(+)